MSDARCEETMTLRKPNPALVALAAAPVVAAPVVLLSALATESWGAFFVPHMLIFGGLALATVLRRRPWAVFEQVPLVATAEGLRAGTTVVPRDEITRALFVPPSQSGEALLRVERRRALPLEVVVFSEPQAHAILAALGMDAAHAALSFRTMSRLVASRGRTWLIGLLIVAAMLGASVASRIAPEFAPFSMLFLVLPVIVAMVVPTRVTVGADGVLARWMGRAHFIASGAIASVERYDEGWGRNHTVGVKLHLAGGETYKIPVGSYGWANDEAGALAERIEQAVASHRRGDAQSRVSDLLRGERTVAQWIAALRALGAGGGATFRKAEVDAERLFRVLESPSASAEERAAAAVALSASERPALRSRVRVVADAVADPALRAVIDAASRDDAEGLAEKMQGFEAKRG